MPKSDLDMLIDDIDTLIKPFGIQMLVYREIDELITSALKTIGLRNISDTNTGRYVFCEIAKKYFDTDIDYILEDDITNIWGNYKQGRRVGEANYNVSDSMIGGFREIDIETDDWGITSQENYDGNGHRKYPSDLRPDAGRYSPNHITRTLDDIEDGNLAEFEFFLNEVQDKIADFLEGGL